jgi:hypothetical protein
MIVASRGVNPTEVTDDFTAHVRRFHGCGGSAHLCRGASNQEETDTEVAIRNAHYSLISQAL